MIEKSFNLRKFLILSSPLVTSFFFIFLDSIPFYLFKDYSLKTQFGLIILYIWVCLNPDAIRPLYILVLGLLIDVLNGFFFGFSSFFLSIVLFLQKKNIRILNSSDFKINLFKFFLIIFFINIFSAILEKFFNIDVIINFKDLLLINLISFITFPFLMSVVNYLNNQLKLYVE